MRLISTAAVVLSLVVMGAPAPAQVSLDSPEANNMEFVANVPAPSLTHLEFLTKEVDGVVRTYAIAGSRDVENGGLHIVDVTDPESPVLTAVVPCADVHNMDPQVSPDGTIVTITAENGDACRVFPFRRPGFQQDVTDIGLVDVSDPTRPIMFGTPNGSPDFRGVHTAVFHPSENILYLSNQETPDRNAQLGIMDLRGGILAAQSKLVPMPQVGSGPHDITFSHDGTRAYVSAVTASYILDTTDPVNPQVIAHIVDPSINIHHEAMLSPNGRYLLIVDEQGGALVAPACPGGGVHIYDVTDDALPVKVGVFLANETRPAAVVWDGDTGNLPVCTAHEGNFSPDGNLLSLAWYWAGARVFDVSALNTDDVTSSPVVSEVASIRPAPVDNWAAKIHPKAPDYVIATNQRTGLDVYRITLPAA